MSIANSIQFSELSIGSKILYLFGYLIKFVIIELIFLGLFILKLKSYNGTNESIIGFFALLTIVCCVYFVFYIITEGILKRMILGIIISIIGSVLSVLFPPIGLVILIIGVISILKSFNNVLRLFPLAILGLFIFIFLFDNFVNESLNINIYIPFFKLDISSFNIFRQFGIKNIVIISYSNILYFILTTIVSLNLSFKYSLKNSIFRICVIFMAIPIIALLFLLIKSALANSITNSQSIQSSTINRGKIYVNSYFRANGTPVRGYFRKI